MIEEKTLFHKDEEKDINLLLSRVKKNPSHFKDRVIAKLMEFNQEFEKVKKNPGEKNILFKNLCMFFGQIFNHFPKELKIILEALMQLFDVFGERLNPSIRYNIIQTLLVV